MSQAGRNSIQTSVYGHRHKQLQTAGTLRYVVTNLRNRPRRIQPNKLC
jgi:hypothetical protein